MTGYSFIKPMRKALVYQVSWCVYPARRVRHSIRHAITTVLISRPTFSSQRELQSLLLYGIELIDENTRVYPTNTLQPIKPLYLKTYLA
jgi:hypothetical protein